MEGMVVAGSFRYVCELAAHAYDLTLRIEVLLAFHSYNIVVKVGVARSGEEIFEGDGEIVVGRNLNKRGATGIIGIIVQLVGNTVAVAITDLDLLHVAVYVDIALDFANICQVDFEAILFTEICEFHRNPRFGTILYREATADIALGIGDSAEGNARTARRIFHNLNKGAVYRVHAVDHGHPDRVGRRILEHKIRGAVHVFDIHMKGDGFGLRRRFNVGQRVGDGKKPCKIFILARTG